MWVVFNTTGSDLQCFNTSREIVDVPAGPPEFCLRHTVEPLRPLQAPIGPFRTVGPCVRGLLMQTPLDKTGKVYTHLMAEGATGLFIIVTKHGFEALGTVVPEVLRSLSAFYAVDFATDVCSRYKEIHVVTPETFNDHNTVLNFCRCLQLK